MRNAGAAHDEWRTMGGCESCVLFWIRDSGANSALGGYARLGESIVTRVEILAILKQSVPQRTIVRREATDLLHFCEDVLVGWQLSIEPEELLFFVRQFLDRREHVRWGDRG